MTFLIALCAVSLNMICMLIAFAVGIFYARKEKPKQIEEEKKKPTELSPEEKARREVERREIANFYAYNGDRQEDPQQTV